MKIEMNVFSGRQNPSINLDGKLLAEFHERASDFKSADLKKPDGLVLPLGYAGFTATPGNGRGDVMHIHSARLERSKSVDFERWLLDVVNQGPVLFAPKFRRTMLQGIDNGVHAHFQIRRQDNRLYPRIITPDHPIYQPAEWNTPDVQPNNNCYAYGCNDPTGTFPQPGLGTGREYSAINAAEVSAAAISDGLRPLKSWSDIPAQGWRVVLVIWPDEDYHWYRADFDSPANALCSHKPGGTEVRNVDNSGKLIVDPTATSCDHGPYTITVGVFNVPGRELIKIA